MIKPTLAWAELCVQLQHAEISDINFMLTFVRALVAGMRSISPSISPFLLYWSLDWFLVLTERRHISRGRDSMSRRRVSFHILPRVFGLFLRNHSKRWSTFCGRVSNIYGDKNHSSSLEAVLHDLAGRLFVVRTPHIVVSVRNKG